LHIYRKDFLSNGVLKKGKERRKKESKKKKEKKETGTLEFLNSPFRKFSRKEKMNLMFMVNAVMFN